MQKLGAMIQARASSERLREKIFLNLPFNSGITILEQVVARCKTVNYFDNVVVATTQESSDDKTFKICLQKGIDVFRGDSQDVLKRFSDAAKKFNFTAVVRFTADNPFVDPVIVRQVIEFFNQGNYDYVKTEGLPLGTNLEIVSVKILYSLNEAQIPLEHREHVTSYINAHPHLFRIGILNYPNKFDVRLTVDYQSDYALACSIYNSLYSQNNHFGIEDVVNLLKQQPWLSFINSTNFQKKIFSSLQEEINEAEMILKYYDLKRAAEIISKTR